MHVDQSTNEEKREKWFQNKLISIESLTFVVSYEKKKTNKKYL